MLGTVDNFFPYDFYIVGLNLWIGYFLAGVWSYLGLKFLIGLRFFLSIITNCFESHFWFTLDESGLLPCHSHGVDFLVDAYSLGIFKLYVDWFYKYLETIFKGFGLSKFVTDCDFVNKIFFSELWLRYLPLTYSWFAFHLSTYYI